MGFIQMAKMAINQAIKNVRRDIINQDEIDAMYLRMAEFWGPVLTLTPSELFYDRMKNRKAAGGFEFSSFFDGDD